MKNKIIVLSDIHGWLPNSCKDKPNIICHDSRLLGKVDLNGNIHEQFLKGGIDLAARSLTKEEVELVIGLSVGGAIAWRAALFGMNCKRLVLISATRLRKEVEKPRCELELIYGEDDPFRPKEGWFKKLNLSFTLINNGSHEIYKELEILGL